MQKTGPAWNEGRDSWQGSRSTPTVDGEMVYVITPFGKLIAANKDNGQIVWQRDLKEDFSGKKADPWGYSESPLVDGDRVICTPGGSESTVVALNKQSGELIWKLRTSGRPWSWSLKHRDFPTRRPQGLRTEHCGRPHGN